MGAVLITRDAELRVAVERLAAAAGAALTVLEDVAEVMRPWGVASLLLVGADLAQGVADLSPSRRAGVHLVVMGVAPDRTFRLALALGANSVAELPHSSSWLVEALADQGSDAAGVVIGVMGGSGGIGASVFAAGLTQALAPAVLIDADPLGAGAQRLLGMEDVPGVGWEELCGTAGRLSARALRDALPARADVAVISWAQTATAALPMAGAREVLSAARRAFDRVVIDLPRHRDAVAEEMLARCHEVVLVVGTGVAALGAARRVISHLPEVEVRLVVRDCGGIGPSQVDRVLGLQVAHVMSSQRGLDEALDLGAGPLRFSRGPLAKAVREVADQLRGVA